MRGRRRRMTKYGFIIFSEVDRLNLPIEAGKSPRPEDDIIAFFPEMRVFNYGAFFSMTPPDIGQKLSGNFIAGQASEKPFKAAGFFTRKPDMNRNRSVIIAFFSHSRDRDGLVHLPLPG